MHVARPRNNARVALVLYCWFGLQWRFVHIHQTIKRYCVDILATGSHSLLEPRQTVLFCLDLHNFLQLVTPEFDAAIGRRGYKSVITKPIDTCH